MGNRCAPPPPSTNAQQRVVAVPRARQRARHGRCRHQQTHALVERCLNCLCEENPRASLAEILVVTFTEAAAAEIRQRLRRALEERSQKNPGDPHGAEQIPPSLTPPTSARFTVFVSGSCANIFHELGLDPQSAMLDEGEARLLAGEVLDEELQDRYAGETDFDGAVQKLIEDFTEISAAMKKSARWFAAAPLRANPARCGRVASRNKLKHFYRPNRSNGTNGF